MWFSQSGNYINKPAIIEIYTCNHVGIWLQFIDKKQRGVVCLVSRYLCSHWSVSRYIKIVRQTSEPWSIFGRESVSACRNPKCLNVDRPTDDRQKKKLSFDGWAMIDGWSTDSSTTASTEEIDHRRRKKLLPGPTDTTWSADEKKRSNSAKTMADELPTVAQRIPFLLKTRLPLVVFFLNMTSLRFK